jgi:hypothetical protein
VRIDLQDFKRIQIKDQKQSKASAMKNRSKNLKNNQGSTKATMFMVQVTSKPHQQTEARFPKKI